MASISLLTILFAGAMLAGVFSSVAGQNCDFAANLCCSRYGSCGTGDAYCGSCYGPTPPATGTGTSVDAVVTTAFFNGIKGISFGSSCEGHQSFYTRQAFLSAANSYPSFGGQGSADDAKTEIAAFFAHVTYETGHFCYIEKGINGSACCDASYTQWPCTQGKSYHARGPIGLSWNYNYGPAGRSIGFDGLNAPETVARDPVVSFKTALWFWMRNVHSVMGQGFGATIRAINILECGGGLPNNVMSRVDYFTSYCQQLGVNPGVNLTC